MDSAAREGSQTLARFQRVLPTALALPGGQQTLSSFISKPTPALVLKVAVLCEAT